MSWLRDRLGATASAGRRWSSSSSSRWWCSCRWSTSWRGSRRCSAGCSRRRRPRGRPAGRWARRRTRRPGRQRALRAAQLAVEDQSVDATDVRVAYAPAGRRTATRRGGYAPTLTPGEEFSVCVTVTVRIPLLPEFIDANTATGQFVVERDRYVDG